VAFIDANYRSISAILADLVSQFTALLRKEGQLARAEMTEKMREIAASLGLVVGGAVLLIPALVILLQAAVAGLVAAGLAVGWASLAVGGVVLLIGLVLLAVGISRLKAQSLMPSKTIEQLQRDATLASHEIRNDHGTPERTA
jgi:membrane protein implicated in regulation of membrane protease activity